MKGSGDKEELYQSNWANGERRSAGREEEGEEALPTDLHCSRELATQNRRGTNHVRVDPRQLDISAALILIASSGPLIGVIGGATSRSECKHIWDLDQSPLVDPFLNPTVEINRSEMDHIHLQLGKYTPHTVEQITLGDRFLLRGSSELFL